MNSNRNEIPVLTCVQAGNVPGKVFDEESMSKKQCNYEQSKYQH